MSDRSYTTPSALATIRANAEAERLRGGWKTAVFWPYGDADAVIALVDEIEALCARIKRLLDEDAP